MWSISEIVAILIVYSGLSIYYIVPFRNQLSYKNDNESYKVKFADAFRENAKILFFHKRAILAYLLLIFSLVVIWLVFEGAEYHTNAHSGYPPISTDVEAILSMIGILVYTIVLYLSLVFVRTILWIKTNSK